MRIGVSEFRCNGVTVKHVISTDNKIRKLQLKKEDRNG
jgi:hypothetical protein